MSIFKILSPILHLRESDKQLLYVFWCPACAEHHIVTIDKNPPPDRPQWCFNGNAELPSFIPSWRGKYDRGFGPQVCHLNITRGKIVYHNDCTHRMPSRTIDMVAMSSRELGEPTNG